MQETLELDGMLVEVSGDGRAIADFRASMARQADREKAFPGTGRQKMTALCRLFPTLQAAQGVEPWNFDRFVLWVLANPQGSGQAHAVRFVLSVWNFSSDKVELLQQELRRERPEDPDDRVLWAGLQRLRTPAREILQEQGKPADSASVEALLDQWFSVVGPFNVTAAFSVWDETHREAFRKWAAFPFFP